MSRLKFVNLRRDTKRLLQRGVSCDGGEEENGSALIIGSNVCCPSF